MTLAERMKGCPPCPVCGFSHPHFTGSEPYQYLGDFDPEWSWGDQQVYGAVLRGHLCSKDKLLKRVEALAKEIETADRGIRGEHPPKCKCSLCQFVDRLRGLLEGT